MNQFNWDTSFHVDFDLLTGLSKTAETTKRYLSQMKDMYYDTDAVNEVLKIQLLKQTIVRNYDEAINIDQQRDDKDLVREYERRRDKTVRALQMMKR